MSCAAANGSPTGNGNGTAGLTVDAVSGTIFILPNCTDGTNGFVFGYPAAATGAAVPTIYDPFAGGGFGTVNGLATARGTLYAGYSTDNNGFYGFPVASNGRQPTAVIGTECYAEFGNPSPGCFNIQPTGFGLDSNGFLYSPTYWNDTPTQDAAAFLQPAAVLAVSGSQSGPTVRPFAAIAGLNSVVGGSGGPPFAATVDGSTLFVLTGKGTLNPADSSGTQPAYWPGLSACPPPSANAPINPIDNSDLGSTQCADGQQHMYLAGYSLTSQLLGTSSIGTDVDLIPNFVIGGDTVGGFGCFGGYPGQLLAASGGFVYVINLTPTCPDGLGVFAPEIDVYNTNGISGSHTNIAPVFRLPLTAGYPLAVAIGPSGTVTGGQALLRRPLARPFRPNLYRRRPLSKPRGRSVIPRRPHTAIQNR